MCKKYGGRGGKLHLTVLMETKAYIIWGYSVRKGTKLCKKTFIWNEEKSHNKLKLKKMINTVIISKARKITAVLLMNYLIHICRTSPCFWQCNL